VRGARSHTGIDNGGSGRRAGTAGCYLLDDDRDAHVVGA
jgi:hypothetical protein